MNVSACFEDFMKTSNKGFLTGPSMNNSAITWLRTDFSSPLSNGLHASAHSHLRFSQRKKPENSVRLKKNRPSFPTMFYVTLRETWHTTSKTSQRQPKDSVGSDSLSAPFSTEFYTIFASKNLSGERITTPQTEKSHP